MAKTKAYTVHSTGAVPFPTERIEFELPLSEESEGYRLKWLNLQLTGKQPEMFRRVYEGLIQSGAKMANGQPVSKAEHVFYYILDQCASQAKN